VEAVKGRNRATNDVRPISLLPHGPDGDAVTNVARGSQDDGPDRRPSRPHWLERERILLYPCLILLALYVGVVGIRLARSLPDLVDPLGRPIGNDFIAFWSAARLAVEGRAAAAYDPGAIAAAHLLAVPALHDTTVRWHYPPTYLLILFPLGLLPYLPAFGAFLAATIALWAALIRRMFADPRAWIVAAAFPAGLYNLGSGQNGFLTAGLAGFALIALDRRPVVAGVLIGLLAVKPHLAILFPLALIAERRWRSFAAAAASAVGFTALSVAVFGWATIPALLQDLATMRGLIESPSRWQMIPSVYVSALSFGLGAVPAIVLHAAVAIAAGGCVWFVWRGAAPREAKMATLCAASLLVSPYIFVYDLTWTGLAIAWLATLGMRRGFRPGEREFLAGAWVASILPRIVYGATGVQLGWLLPLLLTIAGVLHALHSTAGSGGSTGAAAASRPTAGV
jgi:hypothetical protein